MIVVAARVELQTQLSVEVQTLLDQYGRTLDEPNFVTYTKRYLRERAREFSENFTVTLTYVLQYLLFSAYRASLVIILDLLILA